MELTANIDVMERISYVDWSCAGHIARRTDECRTKTTMNWRRPYLRPRGRPHERWTNTITKFLKETF